MKTNKTVAALFFWAQVAGFGALFALGGQEMVNTQDFDGGTVMTLAVS
jgi:hypothetical protein